ncbi:hypothetical protein TGVAND_437130 [Toxoplasma gondii VAND]|uniref:Uncharacterized protein n=1 Tax=Toxoplasma gondii VAND TaxID=933077 RepID=A0A086PYB5_TOXGO|nr:hypothetical protein TGVAND_437130 [Toxoplasma gondii VAND]
MLVFASTRKLVLLCKVAASSCASLFSSSRRGPSRDATGTSTSAALDTETLAACELAESHDRDACASGGLQTAGPPRAGACTAPTRLAPGGAGAAGGWLRSQHSRETREARDRRVDECEEDKRGGDREDAKKKLQKRKSKLTKRRSTEERSEEQPTPRRAETRRPKRARSVCRALP